MALDTNIALGVKPIEQPNMLAQMGQMMQMRQMQQGYESENALRDFYAQGGDLSTAEGRRQLMSRAPMQGQKLIGQQSEIAARDIGTAEKSLELYKNQVGFIKSPEDAARWLSNFYANPTTRPYVESVAPMDVALAAIPKNDPAAFQAWLRNASLKAEKLFVDANTIATNQTRVQTANIGAAAPNRQASIAEQRFAAEQEQRKIVRGILTGNETTSVAPPVGGNVSMGGGVNVGGGGVTPAETRSSIFVNPSSVNAFNPYTQNNLITQPQSTSAPNINAGSRVDQIKQQITQLAKVGGPEANQAMEGLVKEYNVLNPAGKIEIGRDGFLRTINERSGVATFVTGADGKPVKGNVTPIIKSVLDQTDPAGKRMIDVDIYEYVQGTGLGADGKGAAPKGVIGISSPQIAPNYLPDPNNPQGVIPVPGSAADPNAVVPPNYRKKADGNLEFIPGGAADPSTVVPPNYRRAANGKDLEFIPGGPADPKVIAATNTVKLSTKDKEAREAKYPQATTALKAFEAKTSKFERDIDELIANEKGLNEITGFFAGRTDLSAMSKEARRAFALFNTITAKGGFSELQDMRNASPTGGALGNVSNQEGRQLIDSFGALTRTQDGNDVRKSLANAKSDLQNLKERMREAYDLTYEYKTQATGGFTYLGKE